MYLLSFFIYSSLIETFFLQSEAEAVEFTLVCLHNLLIRRANEDKMQITNTSCQDKSKNKEIISRIYHLKTTK